MSDGGDANPQAREVGSLMVVYALYRCAGAAGLGSDRDRC